MIGNSFEVDGVCVLPGLLAEPESELNEAASRLAARDDLLDPDPERRACGYLSDRWDLTGDGLATWFPFLATHVVKRLSEWFGMPLVVGESMMHRLPRDRNVGIEWHTDAAVAISPETLALVAVFYPGGLTGKTPLEVRLRGREARTVRLAVPPGAGVLLAPDVLHRVPKAVSHAERLSVVLRLHRADQWGC